MTNTITLNRGCRNRWYYVIVMPLSVLHNDGPADTTKMHTKLTWEVWDQVCESYGSYEYLSEAIDRAEELNEAHLEWESKDS